VDRPGVNNLILHSPKSIFGLKSLVLLLAGFLAAATAVFAEPAAVVGGKTITREALEQHVKGQLFKLENERYEILRTGLDELIGEQLIALAAEAQGQTPEQFMTRCVLSTATFRSIFTKMRGRRRVRSVAPSSRGSSGPTMSA